ncbi:hypothetical protein EC991_000248 [Linnemannia zychae]|nr:hypothetical protein EC991_000248 [Linnemannia zychae]
MGSTPSKIKKKNRQSSQSLSKKAKKAASNNNARPRPLSESSVIPAGPSQWNNNSHHINEQHEQAQLLLQQQQKKLEESVDYSPMNNYDTQDLYQGQGRSKPTLSSNNIGAKNNGKASSRGQAKTGSSGLPSFSLLKRKSNPSPRRRQETEVSEFSNKPLDISSPIIESKITMGAGNYSRDLSYGSLSTEQTTPPRRNTPRQSLEANQFQQQTYAYVEPPKPNAGAYKAPVPSIPTSAAQTQMSSSMPSLSPMNMDSSPSLPSTDSVAYPPPPGSTALTSLSISSYYQQQDPNYSLWRESLRNAAATAVDGRKNTEPTPLSRSESQRSQNSRASSTFSSSGEAHKNKPVSGPTIATTLSPSPSNASSKSSGFKKRHNRDSTGDIKTNSALPDGSAIAESSRLNANQVRLYLQSQQQENNAASENASTLSLPGSRYIGGNHSFRTDDESGNNNNNNASLHTDRNASEISLLGSPVSGAATGINTPSLAGGIRTPKRDSQFSSPRHSTASSLHRQKRISSPLSSPVALDGGVGAATGDIPASPIKALAHNISTRTANSSARESVSSISTANYHWMEDQNVNSGLQDAMNRDSVLMLFPSPTTIADTDGSQGRSTPAASPTTAPTTATESSPTVPARPPPATASGEQPLFNMEQMAKQSLEQQAQQHALLKYFFKGNYHAPLNKEELGSVLDVGCGAGLWMRDMAIEFPLTEIHGVDAVVPTRKRRPRVPPSTTNSASGSPNLTPFASKHSSVQSANQGQGPPTTIPEKAASFGSFTKVPPAMLDSMPSNCFFHKADTTRGLPFPDNTFDFCRIRLVLWGYHLNSFPDLLSELIRVTKKGGWIEFVDMDPCIKKANETGTRINEWIKTGLIHGNLDPDLVRSLPQFLREYCDATMDAAIAETLPEDQRRDSQYRSGTLILPTEPYGLDQLAVSKISLPFGPWGGKVGELWQKCFTTFLQELEPLIMDATLSGLVMDQYHRQFQQEMQLRFAEAAAASEVSENIGSSDPSAKSKERVTSFDQRLCTHLAWSNLIDQLVKDATISSISLTNPASKSTPYSHANFLSSVKEVRSYNNFYIAYAQKVDVVELKQQYVLSQLEQEILSPNPGMASSMATFPTLEAAAAYNRAVNNLQKLEQDAAASAAMKDQNDEDGYAEPADQQSDTSHMGHTVIQKVSSPNLRQHYFATMPGPEPAFSSPSSRDVPLEALEDLPLAEKEEVKGDYDEAAAPNTSRYGLVASLTHDALESFNRATATSTTAAAADSHSHQSQDAVATLGSTAGPPTPTSVAALSIRSNSRSSYRNNSITTPGSVSATGIGSGLGGVSGSPRIGYGGLRHQESIKNNNGLHSPQAQSATVVVVADEDEHQDWSSDQQQQDYFNHMPIKPQPYHPTIYHQQQYHHHYQQQQQAQQMQTQQTQAQTMKRKSSLLSKVLDPSTSGSVSSSPPADVVSVAAATVGVGGTTASSSASPSKMSVHGEEDEEDQPAENEEDSEILIALHDDVPNQGGTGEDTIEILNQVSRHDQGDYRDYHHDPGPTEPVIHPVKDDEVESIDGPLEMLTPVDDDGGSGDGLEGGDDEVVFVMMAPPSQSPNHPPVPVEDPGPVRDASVSAVEAARVPLPLPEPESGPSVM